ncbi:MAG: type II toxin-antitoxin system HicA family toxin [Waterburya sp.]
MKVKILKSRLSKAGFVLQTKRGKGSHSFWRHHLYPVSVVQSGKDNSDAKPYQIKKIFLVREEN